MNKKNLIFLTLLISVLMVSVVSASITGYLVSRGGGIADSGYRATLQKVDASGVASISVQTPSGSTEVVRVAEGETAQVGEAEISASSLTRGTLFRRGGAKIDLNISAGPAPDAINIGKGVVVSGGNQTNVTIGCLNNYCGGMILNMKAVSFKYWDKKDNLDYHKYLVALSDSGQSYTLDFKVREDPGNNINETDVYNVVTGAFEATDKVAGDTVNLFNGDVVFTIAEVYVTATDKYVKMVASCGTYFSESCIFQDGVFGSTN